MSANILPTVPSGTHAGRTKKLNPVDLRKQKECSAALLL
jgi:hypothetical protein